MFLSVMAKLAMDENFGLFFNSLEYVIFKYRYEIHVLYFFFFFIFVCMGPRLNHKRKTRLKYYWFVKTGCLKVMIWYFSGRFHACMHIHVKLLLSRSIYTCEFIEVSDKKIFSVIFHRKYLQWKTAFLQSLSIVLLKQINDRKYKFCHL